jgi:hypothetical protein
MIVALLLHSYPVVFFMVHHFSKFQPVYEKIKKEHVATSDVTQWQSPMWSDLDGG